MAIARVQNPDSGQRKNVAAGSSLVFNFTQTPTSGNLLILAVAVNATVTLTAPTGWTLIEGALYASHLQQSFWRAADGTEGTSLTLNASGATRWCVWMGEYSGADTSSPIAGSNIDSSGSASGLGAGMPVNNVYYGSLHLVFPSVRDSGADVTIDTATRTNNPKGMSYVGSTSGSPSVAAIFQTTSASSDTSKIWMRPMERILTGTDNSQDLFSEYYGSSVDTGIDCSVVINPASAGRTAVVYASGTGTGVHKKQNSGTFTAGAASPVNISCSLTAGGTTVGHLLVLCIYIGYANAATITDTLATPSGWTLYSNFPLTDYTNADTNQAALWYLFYRIASQTTDDAVTVVKTGIQSGGGWSMHSFSGPFALAVGPTMEEGQDSCFGFLEPTNLAETTGTGLASDNALTHPSGEIGCAGDSIQYAAFVRATVAPTFSDSFTVGINAATNAPNDAYKITLVGGRSGTIATEARNVTSGSSIKGGIIVGFKVNPAGSDHWGWAEGNDAHDSWQLVTS